MEWWVKKV
ncbi:hypothetical protein JTN12_04810, partial [Klebsiella quasipneumoniae]